MFPEFLSIEREVLVAQGEYSAVEVNLERVIPADESGNV